MYDCIIVCVSLVRLFASVRVVRVVLCLFALLLSIVVYDCACLCMFAYGRVCLCMGVYVCV